MTIYAEPIFYRLSLDGQPYDAGAAWAFGMRAAPNVAAGGFPDFAKHNHVTCEACREMRLKMKAKWKIDDAS